MNESMAGMTFKAMKEAAETDQAIARRVALYQFRVKEELFDYENDPDALENLADRPEYSQMVRDMRSKMREYMETSGDELLPQFLKDMNAV